MKRVLEDNHYFQNHPNEAKAIVQEAQSILSNVFDETDAKRTKFSKQILDIIKQEMQDRFKHLVVPKEIVQHILKQLPAKECWRIASRLNKDYRKWVQNNVLDVYTLVTEKFSHKHSYNHTVYTERVSRSIVCTACYVKDNPFCIVFEKDLKEAQKEKERYIMIFKKMEDGMKVSVPIPEEKKSSKKPTKKSSKKETKKSPKKSTKK